MSLMTNLRTRKYVNSFFKDYVRGARRRNRSFELTFNEFDTISSKACFFCGEEPKPRIVSVTVYAGKKTQTGWAKEKMVTEPRNGIDRLDNTKGYTLENCVPCCSVCNKLKSVLTLDEFLTAITKIYNFRMRK
jgi:hypothetical protein